MYRSRPFRRGRRPDARRAFTLVELITAASLMTVMMLGVVQIFSIITRTAADAEGLHFAQQQMRPFFDRLHTDLRGMTREGYLKIHTATNTPQGLGYAYDINTLAFVTVGPCLTQWHTTNNTAREANAAEVVYTSSVRTPSQVLRVVSGNLTKQVDPRRGILGRGQWMLGLPDENGTAADTDDRPSTEVAWLCNMFINQNPPKGTSVAAKDRISSVGDWLVVYPWTTLYGKSDQPQSLKRVMASCVSDFYVEVFNPKAATGTAMFESPNSTNIGIKDFVWSTNFAATKLKSWPRAIRVTVAVHDPGDTSAPKTGPTGQPLPLEGYVMQEIFWLSDP
ncbi:MAG: hypothetical protein IMZ66_12350 [Planctomycetes bacterium]|nr:hypothetical protein [Planctomycetota bacterium]